MFETFVARMLALRNSAHLAHWLTGNYAAHVALGDFYDQLLDKLDEIVEIYQGNSDLAGLVFPNLPADGEDAIGKLRAEWEWITGNREGITGGDPVLENQLDELGAIFGRTLYKLRRLS